MMNRTLYLLMILALLAFTAHVGLVGCASGGDDMEGEGDGDAMQEGDPDGPMHGVLMMGQQENPEVIAIGFWADWCSKCKELVPKWHSVAPNYADRIQLIRLDFSDDEQTDASRAAMSAHNLDAAWADGDGKTGFVLLVDAGDRSVIGRVQASKTAEEMAELVQAALDSVAN